MAAGACHAPDGGGSSRTLTAVPVGVPSVRFLRRLVPVGAGSPPEDVRVSASVILRAAVGIDPLAYRGTWFSVT